MTTHDYTRFARPLAHPGEHLREDFLPSYSLTAGALAKALRLGKVFGTSPEFWMNLQNQHDLSVAAIAVPDELAAITMIEAA